MENDTFNKIKNLCKEANISISQLETILKIGSSTISKWKSSNPSADKLSLVADYFGVSLDYLMGRTKIKKTSDDALSDCRIISFTRTMEKLEEKDQKKAMDFLKMFEDAFSED